MKKTIIVAVLSALSFSLFCQSTDTKKYYIEPGIRLGKTLPFDGDDAYLWQQPVIGADIRLGIITNGYQEWHSWFNNPSYGFALRYEYNYGTVQDQADSPRLGNDIALYAFYDGTVFETNRFKMDYSLGGGIAYWFFCDDPAVGTQNNRFIGSHLNVHINLDMGISYYLNKQQDLFLRGGIAHSSNAAYRLPDRGVNSLNAIVGVRYHFVERTASKEYDGPKEAYTKHAIHVADGIGLIESEVNHKYMFCNTLQFGYSYRYRPKFRAGIGLDLMYTPEYKALFERDGALDLFNWHNNWNVGGYGSIEVLYNCFVFHFALAGYLYRGGKPDHFLGAYKPFYERLGARFYVDKNKRQFVGVTAKLHFGVIDYLEWTYGIQIFNR
jgi:hypothetical protein